MALFPHFSHFLKNLQPLWRTQRLPVSCNYFIPYPIPKKIHFPLEFHNNWDRNEEIWPDYWNFSGQFPVYRILPRMTNNVDCHPGWFARFPLEISINLNKIWLCVYVARLPLPRSTQSGTQTASLPPARPGPLLSTVDSRPLQPPPVLFSLFGGCLLPASSLVSSLFAGSFSSRQIQSNTRVTLLSSEVVIPSLQ